MRYFICIFILFLTCAAVFAEDFDRGTISGLVQDKNLSAIEGVQVTIIGTENVCFTDSTGFFYFGDLEPGNYSLSFFMEGYEKVEKKLTVPKGQARALTVQLKPPGSASEPNSPVTLNPLAFSSYTIYVANSGRPYVNNYDPMHSGIFLFMTLIHLLHCVIRMKVKKPTVKQMSSSINFIQTLQVKMLKLL